MQTQVKGNYKEVMARFDRSLFEALKPKQGEMEIISFTGSKKGDRVHLRFLSPIKADWISDIVDDGVNEQEAYFIDEATTMPFPLRYWRHKHIVRKITEDSCLIIDDMTFKGPNFLITLLLYPAIYIAFYPRRKIYQAYFS
ncbi:MAG: hypothetical protein AAGG75_00385 [Bacteroidota bacterium]